MKCVAEGSRRIFDQTERKEVREMCWRQGKEEDQATVELNDLLIPRLVGNEQREVKKTVAARSLNLSKTEAKQTVICKMVRTERKEWNGLHGKKKGLGTEAFGVDLSI